MRTWSPFNEARLEVSVRALSTYKNTLSVFWWGPCLAKKKKKIAGNLQLRIFDLHKAGKRYKLISELFISSTQDKLEIKIN